MTWPCGAGRHAIALAERGWRVVAADGARAGVDLMLGEARRRGAANRLEAVVADLSARPREFAIEPRRYDLVCRFLFLRRPLFPAMRDGVRPGGLFAAAIHTDAPEARRAPHRFLLEPGELRAIVDRWGWEILHDRDAVPPDPGHTPVRAEIVARRPAVVP